MMMSSSTPREASTSADTMPVRPLPDEQWITTIIVLVQQNIENPAVFFGVVADELAVHLLHDSVDSVALDFLFLHTFQDILHVAGRNGDMDHFEFLLQRALSVRFDR